MGSLWAPYGLRMNQMTYPDGEVLTYVRRLGDVGS